MRYYAAFGGVLRSAVDLPELAETGGRTPDWTLRIGAGLPSDISVTRLGERRVGPATFQLSAIPGGLRLVYSHAGSYDITDAGATIVWYPSDDPQPELVRAIVLGPVLALALEAAGVFCLHGSAVAFEGRGVAFLAPKHHGKSTLAIALAAGGAQFIGDDTLAISPGPPAMLLPGIASARLWEDAASALRIDELCGSVIPGIKTTATGFPAEALLRDTAPLEAVYVLEPMSASETEQPVRRTRLRAAAATIALAHHTKLPDSLVGYQAAGKRLGGAATVASSVPIYTLQIARSFALLPAVVDGLFAWHLPGSKAPVGATP